MTIDFSNAQSWLPCDDTPMDVAAERYMSRDFEISPCQGKRPSGNGSRLISPSWWKNQPELNIAWQLPTLFVVLDVDGDTGRRSLQKLERIRGPLPQTLRAITGNGGHLVFTVPFDVTTPKRRILVDGVHVIQKQRELVDGIDLHGKGDFIVVAPSLHSNGFRYKWTERVAPAQAPAWLMEWLVAGIPPLEKASEPEDGIVAERFISDDHLKNRYNITRREFEPDRIARERANLQHHLASYLSAKQRIMHELALSAGDSFPYFFSAAKRWQRAEQLYAEGVARGVYPKDENK